MKRFAMFLLTASAAPAVWSQVANGPAQAPTQMVQAQPDGKCRTVRPGDTVNFTLTIDSAENAKVVYAELQMRSGRGHVKTADLPAPGDGSLNGGGAGTRDDQKSNVYHFSFKVPMGMFGGVYRGVGIAVSTDAPKLTSDMSEHVDVTKKAHDQVKHYCLAVASGAGVNGKPLVTSFQPGAVEAKQ